MPLAAFRFTDRAVPLIELGIGDSRSPAGGTTWDGAYWDVDPAVWAGTEPSWQDISCDTRSARVEYGRKATTDRFVPGVATIVVDNATGWADPNTADPPGVVSLRPGRQIRVSVNHDVHGVCVLFRGYIDAMIPIYTPADTDTVELSCIDALGEVNRGKLKPVDPPVGASEWASDRIERILDVSGWSPRDIWPSGETLLATDLGGQVADLLGRTADSAGGVVFGDHRGRVAFRPRDWQTFTPGTPVDGTIGNISTTISGSSGDVVEGPDDVVFGSFDVVFSTGSVVGGDICPVAWERPFARADITTRAIIGRDLATAVVVDDEDGIARYGIEPFERTDLLTEDDSTLLLLAERVLRTRSEATAPRVRSVSFDAATSTAALDLMATVDVYKPSRYRCRLQYPAPRGLVFDDEYFATGAAHDLTPARWTLELNLDLAESFEMVGARWDEGEWDDALWADADLLTGVP